MLWEIINFCFKAIKVDRITVYTIDKYGAKWTTLDKKPSVKFTKATFKQSVIVLFSNCFFKLENEVFQQVIESSLGLYPA